nr:MAG TPA: hypothetical protein [Caudoviricetes sp.]
MMNLFYEDLPVTIQVCGESIPIVTDFREYIKLLDMLKDDDVSETERILLLNEYFLKEVLDIEEGINRLSDFVSMKALEKVCLEEENSEEEHQEPEEQKVEKPLFSFSVDYPYILSGFMRDYGLDLLSVKYLHWWKFRMLFDGLSDDTEIKQRIMYRSIDLSSIKDKDERKRIQRIQRSIQLPQEALSDYEIGDVFA